MSRRILPGETIGVIGGGQLGRMLALEARRMGYRVAVLSAGSDSPAAQVADVHVMRAFDDAEAAAELAACSDVVTLETEHVPLALLERLETMKPVHPSARVLGVIQDRLAQRRFLELHGVPQAHYAPVSDFATLRAAADVVGLPAVLKTRCAGYDGKGQARVGAAIDLGEAWKAVQEQPAVLESFVDFDKEISVLLARDVHGNVRFHPIAENVHRDHVLRTSRVPARISDELAERARALGSHIACALEHVGMMAIELFVTCDGRLLVNELAPRTHNSGHYSFGACTTSQFEQHVRAICGLPLGDTSLLSPVVMLNLFGDLWRDGSPSWSAVLAHPSARLHLYGKQRALPGRKMGHVLALGQDVEQADALAETIAEDLERNSLRSRDAAGPDHDHQETR